MLRKKLLARRGETLAEVLVAILVCGFSITLLAGMVMTSMRINSQAREMDAGADGTGGFYGALSDAEIHVFDGSEAVCTVKLTGGPTELSISAHCFTPPGADLSVYGEVEP